MMINSIYRALKETTSPRHINVTHIHTLELKKLHILRAYVCVCVCVFVCNVKSKQ
jgi:hypothetical protein